MTEHKPPARPVRTVLEQHIRDRHMTLVEFTEHTEQFAREHHENGMLGMRHLQRLIAGKRGDGRPLGPLKPATARLLEQVTGEPIDVLLSTPKTTDTAHDPAAELRQMLTTARRIDHSVIALLDEQLTTIRQLDRQLGATLIYDETQAKTRQVTELLRHSLAPRTREPLAALLSELCTLAGWQALDTGNITQAWQHYDQGKTAAAESTSAVYQAHAAAEQAFVLLDLTETIDAVQLLDTARTQAKNKAPRVLQSWLAAAHGEALAANGQHTDSLRAFDQAATLLPSEDTTTERPYVALDPIHLARWRGHALARLRDPEAVNTLTTALHQLDKTFVRAETALRIDLATALATAGEHTQARTHSTQATILATQLGSKRQHRRIKEIDSGFSPVL